MRQTIGGTWLLQLMIVFILLFVGYIVLTLNYSRAVKIKNEMITMVEKNEGLNENSISMINHFLLSSNYGTTGVCENKDGVYGALSLESDELETVSAGEKYYYCVKKYKGTNKTNYYQITIFYKFNLPVIGNASSFTIKGTTSNFESNDNNNLYCYSIDGTCSK